MDEQTLLKRARALDKQALSTIFDELYEPLYRYIYHHIGHQATAEDLTAEVFQRLLEQINQGRGPKHYLKAWMYRVAHNLVVDELRRRKHREHDELDENIIISEAAPDSSEQDVLLRDYAREALQQLTNKQRAAILLKYLRGMENYEIARILKVTEGAVRALQFRGLSVLRQRFSTSGVLAGEEDDFTV